MEETQQFQNTVYVPISRGWCLENVLSCLSRLYIDRMSTEVVILIDTNNEHFISSVKKHYEESGLHRLFGLTTIAASGLPKVAEDAPIIARRQRIIEMWNLARGHFHDTKYFFSFEDDTFINGNVFEGLREQLLVQGADYVEGVEAHRQYNSIGAWQIERNYARTLSYHHSGLSEINGGGFYCFITYTKHIKEAFFREDGACFGPDVCFVYDLVKKGGKAYIYWDIKCIHLLGRGLQNELRPDQATEVLRFEKVKGDWNLIA